MSQQTLLSKFYVKTVPDDHPPYQIDDGLYRRFDQRNNLTVGRPNWDESKEARQYWQHELRRLTELWDDAIKVHSGLDYAMKLMASLQGQLLEIDQPPEELQTYPKDRRNAILLERRKIVQALIETAIIWSDGSVKLVGCLDGSESVSNELPVTWDRS